MMTKPVIEPFPPEQIKFEYSGEQTRHCLGCTYSIAEGETVMMERYRYNGEMVAHFWHLYCWSESRYSPFYMGS